MSAKKQSEKVLNEIKDYIDAILESYDIGANTDFEDIQEFDFIALRLSNIRRKTEKQVTEPATLK